MNLTSTIVVAAVLAASVAQSAPIGGDVFEPIFVRGLGVGGTSEITEVIPNINNVVGNAEADVVKNVEMQHLDLSNARASDLVDGSLSKTLTDDGRLQSSKSDNSHAKFGRAKSGTKSAWQSLKKFGTAIRKGYEATLSRDPLDGFKSGTFDTNRVGLVKEAHKEFDRRLQSAKAETVTSDAALHISQSPLKLMGPLLAAPSSIRFRLYQRKYTRAKSLAL